MSEKPAETPDLVSGVMPRARWWSHQADGRILCTLCPRLCRLAEGQAGFCIVRKNVGGTLVALAYGQPAALAVDPIEKKPLYHYLPGTRILSMGTAGCNMGCRFCQNWDLSKARSVLARSTPLPPDRLAALARREACLSVAFTYNEPTIYGEYVIDAARACRQEGIATVMVTNGYITREAIDEIYPWVDAANVDLKAFTDGFYRKQTASRLRPVLAALERIRARGTWIEVTTLLIPGLNDGDEEIAAECDWLRDHLGPEVPVHFSAFHPDYRLTDRGPTPVETLTRARDIARGHGLRHVYCGNVRERDGHTTFCPDCGRALVRRDWHLVVENVLATTGACVCGRRIAGRFVIDQRQRASSRGTDG